MYLEYFGLSRFPFHVTPDPEFIYFTKQHEEALNRLRFGIESNAGFIVLTGEVGSGKTTLLRKFISELKDNHAFIFNPQDDFPGLLQQILKEFRIRCPEKASTSDQIEKLNRKALKNLSENREMILIIDEAQTLSSETIEKIRLLTNLETDRKKLLNIVMAGQPELSKIIDSPELSQLKQRIGMRFHLTPLTFEELNPYIQHRLKVSGCQKDRKPDFSSAALRQIHRSSRGIPRTVNLICHQALITAFGKDTKKISGTDIRLISEEFSLNEKKRPQHLYVSLWLITAVTVWMIVQAFFHDEKISESKTTQLAATIEISSSQQTSEDSFEISVDDIKLQIPQGTAGTFEAVMINLTDETTEEKSSEIEVFRTVEAVVELKKAEEPVFREIPAVKKEKVQPQVIQIAAAPELAPVIKVKEENVKKPEDKKIKPSAELEAEKKQSEKPEKKELIGETLKEDYSTYPVIYLKKVENRVILLPDEVRPVKYHAAGGTDFAGYSADGLSFVASGGIYRVVLDFTGISEGKGVKKLLSPTGEISLIDFSVDNTPPEVIPPEIQKKDGKISFFFPVETTRDFWMKVNQKKIDLYYDFSKKGYRGGMESDEKLQTAEITVGARDRAGNRSEFSYFWNFSR